MKKLVNFYKEKIYYPLYRFFVWKVWDKIRPGTLKHHYQRIKRGYSDKDVWSLDYWLVQTLTPALEDLRRDKSGVPVAFFRKKDGIDELGNPTEDAHEKAEKRWNDALDEIIYGLRCARYLAENDYWLTDDEKGREKDMRKSAERAFTLIGKNLPNLWI